MCSNDDLDAMVQYLSVPSSHESICANNTAKTCINTNSTGIKQHIRGHRLTPHVCELPFWGLAPSSHECAWLGHAYDQAGCVPWWRPHISSSQAVQCILLHSLLYDDLSCASMRSLLSTQVWHRVNKQHNHRSILDLYTLLTRRQFETPETTYNGPHCTDHDLPCNFLRVHPSHISPRGLRIRLSWPIPLGVMARRRHLGLELVSKLSNLPVGKLQRSAANAIDLGRAVSPIPSVSYLHI